MRILQYEHNWNMQYNIHLYARTSAAAPESGPGAAERPGGRRRGMIIITMIMIIVNIMIISMIIMIIMILI